MYKLCLFLLSITLSTACFGQDTLKKYCLTPDQRRFVLTQAYQLSECDSVRKSLKTQVYLLSQAKEESNLLISNLGEQKYLLSEQLHAKNNDIDLMTKQLHLALVKNKRQRLLTYGVGVLGTITTGYFIIKP